MMDPIAFLYKTDREAEDFGLHFCGPERLQSWEDTLIARYPKDPPDGDGRDVEVIVCAAPARFYTIKALPGSNSSGDPLAGFEISTGSGMGVWVAETARLISEGMLSSGSAEIALLRSQRDALLEALKKILADEERRAKDLRHREAWLPLKFSEKRMAEARTAIAKAEEGR